MTLAAQPQFEPGQVYRTRELRRWGGNPTRLARRLLKEGKLREAARGLFYEPKTSRFGPVPAEDAELIRAFLGNGPFLFTGPPYWNALGLGSTAMFSLKLVYNTERTGQFILDGRRFLLRRVSFPKKAEPEWFVVDLLQHHAMAGISLEELEEGLMATLRAQRWNVEFLRHMAFQYGTKSTLALVERCIDRLDTE